MDLTPAECRVLGCLVEARAVDPDAYPLTLNALRLACNQRTHRVPVVAYDDRTVEDTLLSLKSKGLARFVPPPRGERAARYSQRAGERWRMSDAELAVLAVLLLRGPQTVGEVRERAQRLHAFSDPGQVDAVLDALAARTPKPFAARVAGGPAGGEMRWEEVLTGGSSAGDPAADRHGDGGRRRPPGERAEVAPSYAALVERVAELEHRLVTSLERGALPTARWSAPPLPPPVRDDDGGVPRLAAAQDEHRGLPSGSPSLAAFARDMTDRVADIERRLARIEAQIGALR